MLSFGIVLNNPSKIAELQELEHWKTKFDVAASATEGFFSRRWIASNLFNLDNEEFLRNQREMFYDKKFEATLEVEAEAVVQAGSVEAEADALDVAEEEGLVPPGGHAAAAEEAAAEEAAPEEEPEEETALLAEPGGPPPGHRDDPTIHMGAHGPSVYHPVKVDQRSGMGQHLDSLYGRQVASSTVRNTLPGYQDLMRTSRGINETKETIYIEEENKLFQINNDLKLLIEEMERKNDKNSKEET